MSVELSSQAADTGAIINEQVVNQSVSEDAALEAIWNKNERDNGAERDGGRFVSPDLEKRNEAQAEPANKDPLEGGAGEGQDGGSSTPDAARVPLPANWQGLDEAWGKIPADIQGKISAHQQEIHARMSEQGRQLAAFKPVSEVIEKYGRFFAPDSGYKTADGKVVTPAQGMDFLFKVQDELEKNPVGTIVDIIDRYGVRDQLAAVFGQAPQGDSELRREIAGLKALLSNASNPAMVDERINQRLQQDAAVKAAEAEVSRLSSDKPLYSEIPEKTMVTFINLAWEELGDAASKEAVFTHAYDMAVNANPTLRAKAAAAKAAATTDTGRVEAAKRANSANVTSTSSGKGRTLTDEEELGAVYDRNQKG